MNIKRFYRKALGLLGNTGIRYIFYIARRASRLGYSEEDIERFLDSLTDQQRRYIGKDPKYIMYLWSKWARQEGKG